MTFYVGQSIVGRDGRTHVLAFAAEGLWWSYSHGELVRVEPLYAAYSFDDERVGADRAAELVRRAQRHLKGARRRGAGRA